MGLGQFLGLRGLEGLLVAPLLGQDVFLDFVDVDGSVPDGGEKGVDRGHPALFHHLREHLVREGEAPVLQAALQQFPAGGRPFLLPFAEGLLDLLAGLGRHHPADPVGGRMLVLCRQDLHDVTRMQRFLDGNRLSVDLPAHAMLADVGMDAKGEIQHGRPRRQDPEFAGGREDEDVLGRRLRQLLRAVRIRMLQGIAHGRQPFVQRLLPLDALVGPVGGEAVLRDVVHPLGPDLDLDVGAFLVLDGDMEGLVAVGLGIRHPVPEALRILLVLLRHEAEHLPAQFLLQLDVFRAVDDETDGKHVEDPFEGHLLLDHLAPDGVGGLGADLQLVAGSRPRRA